MVSSVRNVMVLAILAVLACTGYALRCYHCDSVRTPKCGLKFEADSNNMIDCSHLSVPRYLTIPGRNATGCMRKIIETSPGQQQVMRTCFFGDLHNTQAGCESDPTLPYARQLSCEVCTKDECNGSSSLVPITGAILLFFAVARILS